MDLKFAPFVLLAVLLLGSTVSYAAPNYSLTVSTRYDVYSGTTIPIAIYGAVSPAPTKSTSVSIYVYNPSGVEVSSVTAPLTSSGTYNVTVTPTSSWVQGAYIVKAEWALNSTTTPIISTAAFSFGIYEKWTIQTVYTNGVIAPDAAVTIEQNGKTVFSGLTNSSGLLSVSLPDYPITVVATLNGYTGTAQASSNAQTVAVVIPQPAPPYGTQSLSLGSTLITPGGFIIEVQNPPTGIIENIRVTQTYNLPYVVNVQNGIISFNTNQTNFYFLNISFEFPKAQWHEILVTEYSQLMGETITIPEYTFSQNVTLGINVESIVGPHYPTAQEIAAALAKNEQELLQNFTNIVTANVTKTVVPPIHSVLGQTSELTSSVNSLQTAVSSLSNYVSQFQANLGQQINKWEANGYTTIVVIAVVLVILIFSLYYAERRGKSAPEISLG
jgi:hypothetical protein